MDGRVRRQPDGSLVTGEAGIGKTRLAAELAHAAGRSRSRAGTAVPEFASLDKPVQTDPESERFALFDAVAALIEAATRDQHALLVIDDLHWATEPTLLLLDHVIRSERPLRAMVMFRANYEHLQGRLEQCEALAYNALAHRFEGHDETALHNFCLQMVLIRREQEQLNKVTTTVQDLAANNPQLPG